MKMGNEVQTLSNDIHVITAEINAYQRIAGEAIFEIGRRLHEVKYNPKKFGLHVGTDKEGREIVARGTWGEFLSSINTSLDSAKWFIAVFIELGGETNRWLTTNKGVDFLYRIATMPKEQRDQPHTIPSTGESKTVDEMTVRELREVKAELKRKDDIIAEKERSEEILTRQNERLTDELSSVTKPKEIVIEKEVERIVEVDKTDYSAVKRLQAYEERFGALENYSDRVRATNVSDATTAIVSFNMAVRDFIKRHAFLIKYNDTIQYVDQVTQREYNEAVQALKEISADFSKVTGIGDFVDVEYTEVQQ